MQPRHIKIPQNGNNDSTDLSILNKYPPFNISLAKDFYNDDESNKTSARSLDIFKDLTPPDSDWNERTKDNQSVQSLGLLLMLTVLIISATCLPLACCLIHKYCTASSSSTGRGRSHKPRPKSTLVKQIKRISVSGGDGQRTNKIEPFIDSENNHQSAYTSSYPGAAVEGALNKDEKWAQKPSDECNATSLTNEQSDAMTDAANIHDDPDSIRVVNEN